MNQQLVERIRQCPNLPSLPGVAVEVLDLAQRPDADIAQIARLITKDPALSGKILRTVNSSFYARSHPIATLSQALVMLGLQSVKTLVLGFSLVVSLRRGGTKGFDHVAYWKRSVYGATAARILAAGLHLIQQEEVFLAALLKDIGMLVLDQVLGPEYGELHASVASHEQLSAAEAARFGLTHGEAGGLLAAQWKLPPLLVCPIAWHHDPEKVPDPQLRQFSRLAQLAGRCADVFVEEPAAPAVADVRRLCRERHQMDEPAADAMLAEVGGKTSEVARLFEVNIGSAADFESVLRRANETLVAITLRTQQQAATLQAEATELSAQNQALQARSGADPLTAPADRATFAAFLARELASAAGRGQPVSLLWIEADGLREGAPGHGEPAGEKALRHLARLVRDAAGPRGMAGRHEGGAMLLALPGAARARTSALAESLRRAVASGRPDAGGATEPLTVSIGVATFEPGGAPAALKSPAHLLKAAELAAEAARRAGGNCVRVFGLSKPGGASRGGPGAAA